MCSPGRLVPLQNAHTGPFSTWRLSYSMIAEPAKHFKFIYINTSNVLINGLFKRADKSQCSLSISIVFIDVIVYAISSLVTPLSYMCSFDYRLVQACMLC